MVPSFGLSHCTWSHQQCSFGGIYLQGVREQSNDVLDVSLGAIHKHTEHDLT